MSNTVQNTYENTKKNDLHVEENNIYETIDDEILNQKGQKQLKRQEMLCQWQSHSSSCDNTNSDSIKYECY